jgi:hypothetical protein
VASGYVERREGDDARTTFVVLTRPGVGPRRRSRPRAEALHAALAVLLTSTTYGRLLLAKVAVGIMREPGAVSWTCRLCDTDACGRYAGGCPIGNAAAERYA